LIIPNHRRNRDLLLFCGLPVLDLAYGSRPGITFTVIPGHGLLVAHPEQYKITKNRQSVDKKKPKLTQKLGFACGLRTALKSHPSALLFWFAGKTPTISIFL
jgi:hypothetical protein